MAQEMVAPAEVTWAIVTEEIVGAPAGGVVSDLEELMSPAQPEIQNRIAARLTAPIRFRWTRQILREISMAPMAPSRFTTVEQKKSKGSQRRFPAPQQVDNSENKRFKGRDHTVQRYKKRAVTSR